MGIGKIYSEMFTKNQFNILPFSINPQKLRPEFLLRKTRKRKHICDYLCLEADELRWLPGSLMPVILVNIYKPAPELPVLKVHTEQVKCGITQTKP